VKKKANGFKVAFLMHGARNVGGGERSIYLLITHLNRDLFEPLVFYAKRNEIIDKLEDEGVNVYRISLSEKIINVYRDEVKLNPLFVFSYACRMLAGVAALVKALRENEVSILHPHDNLSKLIGGLAASIAGVKTVAHCRDLLGSGLVEKTLGLYQLLFMSRIIAVSNANRDRLAIGKKVPRKVRTIYNGINIAMPSTHSGSSILRERGIKKGTVVLAIIGLFDACKGHIYLFQAIHRLIAGEERNIVCLVVGDGREEVSLRKFVEERLLHEHIQFLGYRNDVEKILKEIDMLIIPSLQESFPRVALEAMAMGVPVVASGVGGLPELVDDGRTGIVVPPGDVSALTVAIARLIDNHDLRVNMGKAGRQRVVERFSIERNARETEGIYIDVSKNF